MLPSSLAQCKRETVVIVGGGSIGLCTAYNLAKSLSPGSASSQSSRIIVIDPFDVPFAASSSQCTGCIHYGFPEKESRSLFPLGKYSFDLWAAEAENEDEGEDFKRETGYRAHSCFGVNPGSGHGIEALPDWFQKNPTWDIDENVLGHRNAMVNPTGVGEWLTAQCLKLGVEIHTGSKVVDAALSSGKSVQAVACLTKDSKTISITCDKLLIACGPWTPTVYKTLFPSSPIDLQPTTNAGDWIVCKSPCPMVRTTVAYVSLAALMGEKLEFAARNDGTIWVCGRRNFTASLPPQGLNAKPDDNLIEELLDHARKWLASECSCVDKHSDELQLVDKGRAFRPATKSGLPVMSQVVVSDLTSDTITATQGSTEEPSSGVFICWGHGSYGLTLGMGTGKVMSQLMRGEKPDLDLSPFSLKRDSDVA